MSIATDNQLIALRTSVRAGEDVRRIATGTPLDTEKTEADPFVTELIRNALNSAANQMKRALIRTAYSPIIYEGWAPVSSHSNRIKSISIIFQVVLV